MSISTNYRSPRARSPSSMACGLIVVALLIVVGLGGVSVLFKMFLPLIP